MRKPIIADDVVGFMLSPRPGDTPLPEFALSIRQPWLWLILNFGKDVENRAWRTSYRGPLALHAAKGMSEEEYDDAMDFAHDIDSSLELPLPSVLPRGGLCGVANLTDCVMRSKSRWFTGKYGLVLDDAREIQFVPCRGELNIFRLKL